MLSSLGPVTAVFGLIGLGYLMARLRLIDAAGNAGLSLFVFYLAIPALLFGGIARGAFASGEPLDITFAYFLTAIPFFFTTLALERLLFRGGIAAAAVFGLNATYGNTVILGLPLLLQLYGERAAGPMFAIIGFHSLTLIPLATVLLEFGMTREAGRLHIARKTLVALLRNPVIMSLAAGLAWNALGLSMPGPVDQLVRMLGAAAGPCALFALGASLAGYRATADLPQALLVSLLKLIVLPFAVWFAAGPLFHLPQLELKVAVTMAALPTGANAFILARRYHVFERSSAATVVISTAISYLTLFALLTLLALGAE